MRSSTAARVASILALQCLPALGKCCAGRAVALAFERGYFRFERCALAVNFGLGGGCQFSQPDGGCPADCRIGENRLT